MNAKCLLIDKETHNELKTYCAKKGMLMGAATRKAIKEFMKKKGK